MHGLVFKIHKLLTNFLTGNEKEKVKRKLSCRVGCKKKALSGVCLSNIRPPNAKQARIQTIRKQGFEKDFPHRFNHTTFSI